MPIIDSKWRPQELADEMGADGYGKDAMACVALARDLIGVEARD